MEETMNCPTCKAPIPDAAIASEIGRRSSARRKNRRGGRVPSCLCGTCLKCKWRLKTARYRAKKKQV